MLLPGAMTVVLFGGLCWIGADPPKPGLLYRDRIGPWQAECRRLARRRSLLVYPVCALLMLWLGLFHFRLI
jgi:hypothetical protein